MKKVFSFIVLLLGVVAINAQVRKETFKNVFVANAAMAGISGEEVAFSESDVIFVFTDMDKGEMLRLY